MMHGSMRFSDSSRRRWQRAIVDCALILLLLTALPVAAHKASDAYLQLAADAAGGTTLRIDVALRDLDAAIDIDADGDGQLTWGEVKAAWPEIDGLVQRHVALADCRFDAASPALERRADGVYAALQLRSACALPADPALRYTLFAEIDPTHRGLLAIAQPQGAPLLRVLDPQRPVDAAASGAEPGAPHASSGFVREGIHHIVTGYDHLLFLLVLMLPAVMRRTPQGWKPVERLGSAVWPIVGIVTAFTVAHSITLVLAAADLVALPAALVEPAIAATIVLAAIDNLRPIFGGRRVLVTFLFGLIHGFGFAGVLGELDLEAWSFAWALLQFNIGLELGQIVVVLLAGGLLYLLRERRLYPPLVIHSGSAAAMLLGCVWLLERTADWPLLRM